jgi:Domain of unknown function (DUF1929)/FG-GAP-like repeat
VITDFAAVPDWFAYENAAAGLAVGDIDGDGQPDLVVLMVDDPPGGQNAAYYRIGWGMAADGNLTGGWSPWVAIPDWFAWVNEGAGVAVADVNGDGQLDLVVFMIDAPDGQNAGYYRIGWGLDAAGTVSGGWSAWTAIPDWFSWANAGGDITVADVDGDGRLDLVVLMVDAPEGPNAGYYRSGPLDQTGVVAAWRPWVAVPDWRFWENQGGGAAVVALGAAGMPHLAVFAIDNPLGPNGAYFRLLDIMTDLEMASHMGVWRLLENDSGVLAIHAALLHTGSVMFFAGSSNDFGRFGAHDYRTAVWHYPSPAMSRPDTPVDLFCCGHAFLPDGRLLAAGGTEQYDPFHGLHQAVIFDPTAGPADPASPTGKAGAWTAAPAMAGGRWYPTLVTLDDGRVLSVAGLDQHSTLNVVPEIYSDGAGWTALPVSPHWPMYAHLFLLADGRLFYSGGQYGDNNGVKPAVWDLGTNAAIDVAGLPDAGTRNQSASVLLPPAQDQRVMIIGGGPYGMHNLTPATDSTAIADLTAAAPVYTPSAPLHMGRMHLCATLLPNRTVLVSGGAMLDEHAADAAFEAEIYHPGHDHWHMAATSRVPRLYHSVALLMPDGKVVTAGSNPQRGVEELRIEVFWPPYLFAGPRPTCQPAQTRVHYGATLAADAPDAADLASACLMRPGATTHSLDSEQRLVDVPFQVTAPGAISLQLPADATIAPPGWYLLFVVNAAGLPSGGAWLQLT